MCAGSIETNGIKLMLTTTRRKSIKRIQTCRIFPVYLHRIFQYQQQLNTYSRRPTLEYIRDLKLAHTHHSHRSLGKMVFISLPAVICIFSHTKVLLISTKYRTLTPPNCNELFMNVFFR